MGIERVYVADPVYETFLAKLTDRVSRLHPGSDEKADYGPMTMPGQIDVISRHLADAVARGGRTQRGPRTRSTRRSPAVAGRGGSRPAIADRERSRVGPIGPRDPSAPR